LILAKSDQQIGKRLLRNGTLTDGLGERNEHWVAGRSGVAGIEFLAPNSKKRKSLISAAYFIAKIV
jgi:hypothetical protein